MGIISTVFSTALKPKASTRALARDFRALHTVICNGGEGIGYGYGYGVWDRRSISKPITMKALTAIHNRSFHHTRLLQKQNPSKQEQTDLDLVGAHAYMVKSVQKAPKTNEVPLLYAMEKVMREGNYWKYSQHTACDLLKTDPVLVELLGVRKERVWRCWKERVDVVDFQMHNKFVGRR